MFNPLIQPISSARRRNPATIMRLLITALTAIVFFMLGCASEPNTSTLDASPPYAVDSLLMASKNDSVFSAVKPYEKGHVKEPSRSKKEAASSYRSRKSGCDSQQCSGTTKKGRRCRNHTTSCNGYCYRHGG